MVMGLGTTIPHSMNFFSECCPVVGFSRVGHKGLFNPFFFMMQLTALIHSQQLPGVSFLKAGRETIMEDSCYTSV
jgi:hypothetical protein